MSCCVFTSSRQPTVVKQTCGVPVSPSLVFTRPPCPCSTQTTLDPERVLRPRWALKSLGDSSPPSPSACAPVRVSLLPLQPTCFVKGSAHAPLSPTVRCQQNLTRLFYTWRPNKHINKVDDKTNTGDGLQSSRDLQSPHVTVVLILFVSKRTVEGVQRFPGRLPGTLLQDINSSRQCHWCKGVGPLLRTSHGGVISQLWSVTHASKGGPPSCFPLPSFFPFYSERDRLCHRGGFPT